MGRPHTNCRNQRRAENGRSPRQADNIAFLIVGKLHQRRSSAIVADWRESAINDWLRNLMFYQVADAP